MGVLSPATLQQIRYGSVRSMESGAVPINFTKPTIAAALQAIEDWIENNRAAVSALIDTATSPVVLSNAQKKRLVAYYMRNKFDREGV